MCNTTSQEVLKFQYNLIVSKVRLVSLMCKDLDNFLFMVIR